MDNLKNKIQRYNAKIRRLKKQANIPDEYIPEIISLKELKNIDENKLNYVKNVTSLILQRNSQKITTKNNIKQPQYLDKLIDIAQNYSEQRRQGYLKEIEKYEKYKQPVSDFENFFDVEEIRERKVNKKSKEKSFKAQMGAMKKYIDNEYFHELNDTYKQNYLKKFKEEFPYLEELYNKLDNMDSSYFAYAYKWDSNFLHINFEYSKWDDETIESSAVNKMINQWETFFKMVGLE